VNSHYDPNQPGQYSKPRTHAAPPKKRMPLWAKIVAGIIAVPIVIVGGCTALVAGSMGAETVAGQADKQPVISTAAPSTHGTPRAPKPVEKAPTKKPGRTVAQEQAIGAAQDYLRVSAYSRAELIDQLTSEYGSGFAKADATYAVDSLKVDWYAQAVKAARAYLEVSNFSRAGLIEQLSSKYGGQFTRAQAVHAVKAVGL